MNKSVKYIYAVMMNKSFFDVNPDVDIKVAKMYLRWLERDAKERLDYTKARKKKRGI